MSGPTYEEVIRFLYQLQRFGVKLGLQNVSRLAELVGAPHERLKFIHVAGTNGKGSTCAMLESIYRQAGLKVGLYTSPHLVSFRERIQVNRKPISKEDVARLGGQLMEILNTHFRGEVFPTFFEVTTVMALLHFLEQRCDLVIWETGLGGRLDATNIVTPLASVLTFIHYDHQKWLGNTIAEIAREKAGIIKPGVPVITCPQLPEAMSVLEMVADTNRSPFIVASEDILDTPAFTNIRLGLIGPHQRMNASLAVCTAQVLREALPVTDSEIRHALETVQWPGRFQVCHGSPWGTLVVDGAHNESGVQRLVETLALQFPGQALNFVVGIAADKDFEKMAGLIGKIASSVCCTRARSARSLDPVRLAASFKEKYPGLEVLTADCLRSALDKTVGNHITVVTGSLYLVGEALELLNCPGLPEPDPLDLNTYKI